MAVELRLAGSARRANGLQRGGIDALGVHEGGRCAHDPVTGRQAAPGQTTGPRELVYRVRHGRHPRTGSPNFPYLDYVVRDYQRGRNGVHATSGSVWPSGARETPDAMARVRPRWWCSSAGRELALRQARLAGPAEAQRARSVVVGLEACDGDDLERRRSASATGGGGGGGPCPLRRRSSWP